VHTLRTEHFFKDNKNGTGKVPNNTKRKLHNLKYLRKFMKYQINKFISILKAGLFLVIVNSNGIAHAIDVIEPVRVMAAQCAQCHGMEGNNSEGFEDLNGESFNEIFDELLEMLDSTDNEIMEHQAKGYTIEQIRDLADYFAGQPNITNGNSGGDGDEDKKKDDEKKNQDEDEDEEEDD
jgi:cytochrome c553